jgi:cellulose synthase operon protein C
MRSFRRLLLHGQPSTHPLALTCAIAVWLVVAATASAAAQPPAERQSPGATLREAERALRSGHYDRVDELTAPLMDTVPAAVVLRVRAAIIRGHDAQAASWLAPLAAADPAGDAALELGLLHLSLGRRADGLRLLQPVLQHGADADDVFALVRAGRAARALGRVEDANDLFRTAAAIAGDDAEVQVAWGELLLEKHNVADAMRSFRVALQGDRRHVPALLGLARGTAETDPARARNVLDRALSINAHDPAAHVFAAELALDDRDVVAATAAVDRALAVNPRHLDARAIQAAIAWLEDERDLFETRVGEVLAIHPGYADVYRIAGSHAARHYRFDEAVSLTERAVALDPEHARAHAELGMHLLRTGDEDRARRVLDAAFRLDPYDVVTYNLLGLLDTLDRFVTIEQGHIHMKLDPAEAPALREHAVPLAVEALEVLSRRYGVTPDGPILIEIFPRHDDFAVRTLGLPGMIGALGACFGRVVTLDSPRARPPNTFNWQATLWHEMAHVVTLQLSRQRVPRWLTEGISVYEEQRARPEWGREMELEFVDVLERGGVIPLADLNKAFTNAATIGLAYYQASLVVEHIVAAHGHDALRTMLVAFGGGADTPAAIRRATGAPMDALQASFTSFLDDRFARLRAVLRVPETVGAAGRGALAGLRDLAAREPGSYPVLVAFGQALQEAGDRDGAMRAYERAAELVPMATGDDSPLALVAQLALEAGQRDRAVAALEQLMAHDHANVDVARRLAALLDGADDRARVARVHARIVELDPFDSASHTVLGRHALAEGDAVTAARWFRVALATNPRDPVTAHCDLADAYMQLGHVRDARRQTLAALELAPTYARAQDLLLAIVEGQP